MHAIGPIKTFISRNCGSKHAVFVCIVVVFAVIFFELLVTVPFRDQMENYQLKADSKYHSFVFYLVLSSCKVNYSLINKPYGFISELHSGAS